MNDKPINENVSGEINYGNLVAGSVPEEKTVYELFISHYSEKDSPEQKLIIEICRQLEEIHDLPTFLDRNRVKSNPLFDINYGMTAKVIIPICTTEYINMFNNEQTSWPFRELGAFIIYEKQEKRNKIIPLLLGVTRDKFQEQDGGIPTIVTSRNVEIPLDADETLIKIKVEEIVKIFRDHQK